MEKYITWYAILLKKHWKRPACFIQLAGMLLLVSLICSIQLPRADTVLAGVYYEDSRYAAQIAEELQKEKGYFSFISYAADDALYEDVIGGRLACGFIFTDEFDVLFEKNALKKSVQYVCTPLTQKGEVIRETFYAALLRVYSTNILKRSEIEIFGNAQKERMAQIIEKNREYQLGDDVFQIEIEYVEQKTGDAAPAASRCYPVQGVVGLVIFFVMLAEYGKRFDYHTNAVERALKSRERVGYSFLNLMAAVSILVVAGGLVCALCEDSRGMFREIFLILLLAVLSGVWILLIGKCLKNEISYVTYIVVLVVIQGLLCPIFWDVSVYIPAVSYVRKLFPIGIYLNF